MNVQEKVAEADRSLKSSEAFYHKAIEDEVSQEEVYVARKEVEEAK